MNHPVRIQVSTKEAQLIASVFEADLTRPTLIVAVLIDHLTDVPLDRRAAIAEDIRQKIVDETPTLSAREFIDIFYADPAVTQHLKAYGIKDVSVQFRDLPEPKGDRDARRGQS